MSRAVLITGSGARLGAHLAKGLAQDGWHIIIHYKSSVNRAEALRSEINSHGGKADIITADLSKAEDTKVLIKRCHALVDMPLNALINNAAMFTPDRATDFNTENYETQMRVNLSAPLILAREFAAQHGAGQNRNIINIIDQRVLRPNPMYFSYSLSKAGLYWATKTMAQDFAPHIRVNAIGPGPTLKNTTQSSDEFAQEEKANLLRHGSPPEDILRGVRYLLSARSVTGQMIAIDSGQHLNWDTADNQLDTAFDPYRGKS